MKFLDEEEYHNIKRVLNGKNHIKFYEKLYELSKNVDVDSMMIDIGTYGGCSAFFMGMGIKKNKKNSQVISFEKEITTLKLNFSLLVKSLFLKYDLDDIVNIIRLDIRIVQPTLFTTDKPIKLVCIDASSCIDLYLNSIYNIIDDDCILVFDDYNSELGFYSKLITDLNKNIIDNKVNFKNDIIKQYNNNPLGKHYTIYKLINYFIEKKVLIKEEILLDNVIICRKNPSILFDYNNYVNDIIDIRNSILDDYLNIVDDTVVNNSIEFSKIKDKTHLMEMYLPFLINDKMSKISKLDL